MSTSKHDNSAGEGPFTSDLEDDPGIGQSKGLFATGADPDTLEADNTSEGDVENETNDAGGVDEPQLGRTTK